MSKFLKRLSKSLLHSRNALVVGTAFGNLEELLSAFSTVFVIDTSEPILRARNLVFKETNDGVSKLPEIDLIVLDQKYYPYIQTYRPLWINKSVTIIIEGGEELINVNAYKLLKLDSYFIVEVYKDYHVLRHLN